MEEEEKGKRRFPFGSGILSESEEDIILGGTVGANARNSG